jgi:hypothetical protein
MKLLLRPEAPPPTVFLRQPPPFYFRLFNGRCRRPACRDPFPEFPKFPEIKIPEGKDVSVNKNLAIDLVRFRKNSGLGCAGFTNGKVSR